MASFQATPSQPTARRLRPCASDWAGQLRAVRSSVGWRSYRISSKGNPNPSRRSPAANASRNQRARCFLLLPNKTGHCARLPPLAPARAEVANLIAVHKHSGQLIGEGGFIGGRFYPFARPSMSGHRTTGVDVKRSPRATQAALFRQSGSPQALRQGGEIFRTVE